MEEVLEFFEHRDRIDALKSPPLSLSFCSLEEPAARLLLLAYLNKDPGYAKYADRVEALMTRWRISTPYSLRSALAASYFHDKKKTSEVVYDGVVVPMNPERMEEFDSDVLFVHGQQSHCFNSWRVLRQSGTGVNPAWRRTYQISHLWPPKFLTQKYASRLITLNYNVCYNCGTG